ncbi:hypothetical protein VHEMI10320 [[Torrubiella] hemipterigena]|uniref:C2H2-type domain-containing protein n=1 Tax=[Torrubiella] hemipterigena TaxID=1531966 RepID=A0A0A1TCP5_9HYPO|nr:hypothetical protein VHEMI10320 [[Torrubiella] hemipterigena]
MPRKNNSATETKDIPLSIEMGQNETKSYYKASISGIKPSVPASNWGWPATNADASLSDVPPPTMTLFLAMFLRRFSTFNSKRESIPIARSSLRKNTPSGKEVKRGGLIQQVGRKEDRSSEPYTITSSNSEDCHMGTDSVNSFHAAEAPINPTKPRYGPANASRYLVQTRDSPRKDAESVDHIVPDIHDMLQDETSDISSDEDTGTEALCIEYPGSVPLQPGSFDPFRSTQRRLDDREWEEFMSGFKRTSFTKCPGSTLASEETTLSTLATKGPSNKRPYPAVGHKGQLNHIPYQDKRHRRSYIDRAAHGRASSKLFACPFCKWKPLLYTKCQGPLLRAVHRVKQHLRRRHLVPIHCQSCNTVFKTQSELGVHARQRPPCEVQEPISWEGLTAKQFEQLGKRGDTTKSEEDQWYDVFKMLFPGYPLPDSPYINSLHSEQLIKLEGFVKDEWPKLFDELADVHIPPALMKEKGMMRIF